MIAAIPRKRAGNPLADAHNDTEIKEQHSPKSAATSTSTMSTVVCAAGWQANRKQCNARAKGIYILLPQRARLVDQEPITYLFEFLERHARTRFNARRSFTRADFLLTEFVLGTQALKRHTAQHVHRVRPHCR